MSMDQFSILRLQFIPNNLMKVLFELKLQPWYLNGTVKMILFGIQQNIWMEQVKCIRHFISYCSLTRPDRFTFTLNLAGMGRSIFSCTPSLLGNSNPVEYPSSSSKQYSTVFAGQSWARAYLELVVIYLMIILGCCHASGHSGGHTKIKHQFLD